ncbi:MAG: hypothetical protein AAF430_22390 [Myxococcota bacterium]
MSFPPPARPVLIAALLVVATAAASARADICSDLTDHANEVRLISGESRRAGDDLTKEQVERVSEIAEKLQSTGKNLATGPATNREVKRLARAVDYAARDASASLKLDPLLSDQLESLDELAASVEALLEHCQSAGDTPRFECDAILKRSREFAVLAKHLRNRNLPLEPKATQALRNTGTQMQNLGARMAQDANAPADERVLFEKLGVSAGAMVGKLDGPPRQLSPALQNLSEDLKNLGTRCRKTNAG